MLLFSFSSSSSGILCEDEMSQWLLGDSIMVAPVLSDVGGKWDAKRTVTLPSLKHTTTKLLKQEAGANSAVSALVSMVVQDVWFEFNSTASHAGGTTLNFAKAPIGLAATPVFVQAGSVLAVMRDAGALQATDDLSLPLATTGPLEIQIYAGADAAFVLVEDDGWSKNYTGADLLIGHHGNETQSGRANQRVTTFRWFEANRTLHWNVDGTFSDDSTHTHLCASLFEASTTGPSRKKAREIGIHGMLGF